MIQVDIEREDSLDAGRSQASGERRSGFTETHESDGKRHCASQLSVGTRVFQSDATRLYRP
jgi:hypothetical protein